MDEVLSHLPEDLAKAKNIWGRALNGETYTITLDFGDNNLERKFYEIQYSPLVDNSGKVIAGLQVARDLTVEGKLKQAEVVLHENERRFRLLAERASDVIATYLPDSTVVYISPSCETILGYRPEELIGLKALDFIHPEDQTKLQLALKGSMDKSQVTTLVWRFRKKDEGYVWFESSGTSVVDQSENLIEFNAISRDISERKRAELLAKEKEELIESVLNTSISGIQVFRSIYDNSGEIVDFEWLYANDSILNLWGLDRKDVIGNRLLTLFPNAKKESAFDHYVRAAKGEQQKFKIFYNYDGLNHWFNLHAIQYHNGFILSSEDISKQVQSEEDIKNHNLSLEKKIKERTKELETINEINKTIAGELDLDAIVKKITDTTTALAKAQFGAFFYNQIDEKGERYTLYQISGVPKEEFSKFPLPRNTKIFEPTFTGSRIVRSNDITQDPNYGKNSPYFGMPKGHLPVKSYLAVPVISLSGEVLGGLFYGHSEPGIFTEESERIVSAISTHAAIAIDNANLFAAQKSSEERFRFMADSMPQLVWTANSNGEIDYYNQNWLAYTGMSIDQDKHSGWKSYLHPEDQENSFKKWRESLATGESYQIECRYKRGSDGTYRWHLARALPMKNEKGEVTKWFGTSTDIHDFKISQEQLEMQAAFLENMNEGISVSDEHGYIIYTNSIEDKMFGYEPGELIGKHVTVQNDYSTDENSAIVEKVIEQVKATGSWSGEWKNRRKDGSSFYTYSNISKLKVENKVLFVCVQGDITEQKAVTQRIEDNEKQLRVIINNIPAYVAYIDSNEIYKFANERYMNLGFTDWPLDGKTVKETLGINYENRKPILKRVLAGETITSEMEMQTNAGEKQYLELKYIPDFDEYNKVKGFLVMGVDLTERIEWQRTLEKNNKELKRINGDLDNFIYTASHDLKAPIANLEGLLTALKKQLDIQNLSTQTKSVVEFMDKSIVRFQETIKGLTEISKTQRNVEEDVEVIEIRGLVEDVNGEISKLVEETGAEFIISTELLDKISFSRYNLRSIFYNLITNAIKYRNPEVPVKIFITTYYSANNAIIEVRDNGLGVKKENLNKIFEMFKRLHTHVEGSGIGLYIVKRIVDNIGGKIEVESELGKGTMFRISLPM